MIINNELLMFKVKRTVIDENRYCPFKTKSGHYTLKINTGSESFFLHSKYDPVKEGGAIAARYEKNADNLTVYGLGLGYHLIPLIKKGKTIHIFETDIQIIVAAFKYTDIKQFLKRNNVFFYYYDSIDIAAKQFYQNIENGGDFAIFKPSLRMNPFFELAVLASPVFFEDNNNVNERNTIIFFNATSQYGALSVFEKHITDSFSKLGYTTRHIDVSDDDFCFATVKNIKRTKYIFSFCLPGMLKNSSELVALFNNADITYVFISVDDPVFHISVHNDYCEKNVNTWIDRNHVKFMDVYGKVLFPVAKNIFLPHGAECESVAYKSCLRDIDVLVSGTITQYYKDETAFRELNLDKTGLAEQVAKYCRNNEHTTIEDAASLFIEKQNEKKEEVINFLISYGKTIYKYLWAKRRYDAVKTVLDEGITVTCYGNGWDKTDLINYKNFKYLGTVSYDEQRAIFDRAKIVLNITGTKKDGSHERVFSAMLHGSLCISDYSKFIDEEFINGEEIVLYKTTGSLPLLINKYLNDEPLRESIAKKGYNKTICKHTWMERAKYLNECLQ